MTDLTPEREAEIRKAYAHMRPHFEECWRNDFDDLLSILDATRAKAAADREAARCWRAYKKLLKAGSHEHVTAMAHSATKGWEYAILAAAEAVLGEGWDTSND